MIFDVALSYVFTGLGLGGVLVVAYLVQSRDVDVHMGNAILMKILADRRIDRAHKICKVAPESYFHALDAAITSAFATQSRDLTVLEAAAYAAFDDKGKELLGLRKARVEVGLIFLLLACTGFATAAWAGRITTPIIVMGSIALVANAWLFYRSPRLAASLALARKEVVPAIVKAIIDGEAPKADDPPFRMVGQPSTRASSPSAPKPRAKTSTSLRDGDCPLCGNAKITRIDNADDPRFHRLVCATCGFAQEFADVTAL